MAELKSQYIDLLSDKFKSKFEYLLLYSKLFCLIGQNKQFEDVTKRALGFFDIYKTQK